MVASLFGQRSFVFADDFSRKHPLLAPRQIFPCVCCTFGKFCYNKIGKILTPQRPKPAASRLFSFFAELTKKRLSAASSCGVVLTSVFQLLTFFERMCPGLEAMIRLEGISKRFGDQVIIPPTDLTVNEGEFLTLLGPSGCGKTTLLRMIAGLETPSSGKIFLADKEVTDLPPYRRDVNMVFQHYALFPHMTVEENIRFGLKMKKVDLQEQDKRVEQVLAMTRLQDLRHRYPKQMSGGQQQRVAIARALVNNPKVVLLDGPLGALDYQLRKNLQLELADLQYDLGITFVYVTHDREEALTMSDRIIVMNKGLIEQDGRPGEIYHRPGNEFVAKFIGETNFFDLGDGLTTLLRPEKLNLCPEEGDDGAHPAPHFFGTITDVVFYGTIDKVFVDLDGSKQEVVAYQYFDDARKWRMDERVGIWWYPQDEVKLSK